MATFDPTTDESPKMAWQLRRRDVPSAAEPGPQRRASHPVGALEDAPAPIRVTFTESDEPSPAHESTIAQSDVGSATTVAAGGPSEIYLG